MKKKVFIIIFAAVFLIAFFALYPTIEFRHDKKLYVFSYSDDMSPFEENLCLSENHSYDAQRDVSFYGWELKEFLFFKLFVLEYEEGNVCSTEYMLPTEYIDAFLSRAEITYNPKNIDLTSLLAGKTVIEGNTRYIGNEYDTVIEYVLDGKHETLFLFYDDDLLIIQVGLSDEGPRFIAYR